jgi:glucan-binding YG repeat protein
MAGPSKLFSTIGTKGEGTLASKLGAALGAKAITEAVGAEEKAAAAFAKLKAEGTPVYKADIESLTKTAAENPKLEVDDLVSQFRSQTEVAPSFTAVEPPAYPGVAKPAEVKVGDKEYPSTFEMEQPPRAPGTESLPAEYGTSTTPKPSKMSQLARPAGIASGVGALGAAGYGASGYWGEEKPKVEDQKQAVSQPVPGQMGGTPPSGTSTDESKPATGKEQEKKDTDVEKVLRESGELIAKLGGNKKVDRSQLQSYLNKLDTLTPDTAVSTPETQRFVQARADAYRAYKEKADRNDWLEVAQNLVNSITQFASAQQAMGTRFEGGNLPLKGIDYGARTARAGREYEMELGQVGAEEKAAESAAERADRLRREELSLKRQTLGEKIGAERERVRQQESDVKDAERQALNLYSIINSNRRNDADNLAALERKTAEIENRGRAAAGKDLDNHIKTLEAEAKALTPKIQSANALSGSSKDSDYKKNLATFATYLGKSEDEIKADAKQNSGWFTFKADYVRENIAGKQASEWARQQQELQRQIADLRRVKFGGEVTPVPSQPATTTPSTTPTRTGKVKVVAPNGQQGEIDAAQVDAFLAKYPGSKVVQ